MNRKCILMTLALMAGATAFGQVKEDFLRQQAYSEMQRISGQVDVIQTNLSDLQNRVGTLEGNGNLKGIRQEIDALNAAVAELRRELEGQRDKIVRDLTARISKIQALSTARPPETKVVIGPHREYVVESGETLSLIAQAFGTTVQKIKEMNGLKDDTIRVGQKLNLPK